MRIAQDDVPKTALRTRYGHFKFLVVPFRLTNVHASFMSIINNIFYDYSDKFVMACLDDILIYSTTWEKHMKHLKSVLSRLRTNKLFVKLSTCIFGVQEIEYLGFVIRARKIALTHNKKRNQSRDYAKESNTCSIISRINQVLSAIHQRLLKDSKTAN